MRLGLSTFDTAKNAARAYNAAAWRLNRHRKEMNFPEVMTMGWAHNVALRPRVVIDEDRRRNRRQQRRLSIAEMDEHAMAEWRRQFPQDVLDERQFFAQRRAEQAALFQMGLKAASTWSSDDGCWVDTFITTEESITGASESDHDDEESFFIGFLSMLCYVVFLAI
ncbi:Ethylene-responsive transcription factor CRF1 [Hordeum vulgare]|nr:Ethylene-responsive transcription factor CRF1 [Hordeum vulgare]